MSKHGFVIVYIKLIILLLQQASGAVGVASGGEGVAEGGGGGDHLRVGREMRWCLWGHTVMCSSDGVDDRKRLVTVALWGRTVFLCPTLGCFQSVRQTRGTVHWTVTAGYSQGVRCSGRHTVSCCCCVVGSSGICQKVRPVRNYSLEHGMITNAVLVFSKVVFLSCVPICGWSCHWRRAVLFVLSISSLTYVSCHFVLVAHGNLPLACWHYWWDIDEKMQNGVPCFRNSLI